MILPISISISPVELKLENAVLVGVFRWLDGRGDDGAVEREVSYVVLVDPFGIKISGLAKDR